MYVVLDISQKHGKGITQMLMNATSGYSFGTSGCCYIPDFV